MTAPASRIDFNQVSDPPTRSILRQLYDYIDSVRRSITGAAAGAWVPIPGGGPSGFQNGWANFGGAYAPASCRLDADGTVRLRGLIAGGAFGATAFVLPIGFRPPASVLSPAVGGGVTVADVQIDPSGAVTPNGTNNAFITLDGITFDTV